MQYGLGLRSICAKDQVPFGKQKNIHTIIHIISQFFSETAAALQQFSPLEKNSRAIFIQC
jgi:hypothetical protein